MTAVLSASDASSSSDAAGATASSGSYGQVADSLELQGESNLLQSLSPQSSTSSTSLTGYPTNILQAAQNQAILQDNPNLAQLLSQASSSPLLAPLTAPVQVLQAMDNGAGSTSSFISSAVSSMAILQEVQNAGTLKTDPALVQSLLPSYLSGLNLSTSGTKVDTTA